MGSAATIIAAIISATAGIASGIAQSRALRRGQEEARSLGQADIARQEREHAETLALERDRLGQQGELTRLGIEEGARQFDITAEMRQQESTYNRLKEQFNKLSQYATDNENFKNLLIGRVSRLGGSRLGGVRPVGTGI